MRLTTAQYVERYAADANRLAARAYRKSTHATLSVEDLRQTAVMALLQAMKSTTRRENDEHYLRRAMQFAVWACNRKAAICIRNDNNARSQNQNRVRTTPCLAIDIERAVATLTPDEREYLEAVIVEGAPHHHAYEKSRSSRLKKSITAKFAHLAEAMEKKQ
jgi:hypothetical protein